MKWLFENDKILHLLAGFLVAYSVYLIILALSMINPWACLLIAGVSSALVSLWKEVVWDKWMDKGVLNWKDFYAGCIGDAICVVVIALMLAVA